MAATRQAIIYTRLSRNRSGEQSESTRRQAQSCRELAKSRGYEVVAVETDDDVSAYSGKTRPAYERVLEALRTGTANAVLAWAPDRLHRSPRELEDFVDLVDQVGAEVVTVQAGRVDLETPAGRMQARMLGTVARFESEHRSARVLAAKEAAAQKGVWQGGKRPYGYRPVDGQLLVNPAEATIVREAADRVIAGERPGTVATDLNRRGVPTTTTAKWTIPTLRNVIGGASVAGIRVYKGEEVGRGQWEAILDPETVRAVRAVLAKGVKRGRAPRVALFTGDRIICGVCGTKMKTIRRTSGNRSYRCPEDYTSVTAEPLETVVTEAVFQRLDALDLSAQENTSANAGRDVDTLELELEQLASDLGSGLITRAEWLAAREPMLERIAEARRAEGESRNAGVLADFTAGGTLRSEWPNLGLDRRQAIIDVLVEQVTVNQTSTRGRTFDPARIDIEWKV